MRLGLRPCLNPNHKETEIARKNSNFQRAMSQTELTEKILKDFKENTDRWKPTGTCFVSALNIGYCCKVLSKETKEKTLGILTKPQKGYSYEYRQLMNITPSSESHVFDESLIDESGIINFIRDDAIFHTAFLQKTDTGDTVLYHSNYVTLDAELSKTKMSKITSPVTSYNLTNGLVSDFQNWLKKNNSSYVFTPASHLK